MGRMKENEAGFQHELGEFEPLRALSIVIAIAQCAGVGVSLLVGHYPSWFENLWFGGALATFPGYLAGLAVQRHLHPNSLVLCRPLIRRMGMVSVVLSLSALVVPLGAFDVS
jgi:hypothetical protein